MSLKTLQKQSGIKADDKFGPTTFREGSRLLGITSHFCAVHFWAQCGHESGNFTRFEENLNYSTKGLLATFSKYYGGNPDLAERHHRKPEQIADWVYGSRMGNGDGASGDGWKYRGRGAIQLTGYDNYRKFANSLTHEQGKAIMTDPDLVSTEYAFESACWFFDVNDLWEICMQGLDESVIKKLTKKINGGYNGLDHRIELTNRYKNYTL